MKLRTLCVLCVALFNFFGVDSNAIEGLQGDWTLVERNCSSGAMPMDGFVLGRDAYNLSFSSDRFTSSLRQEGCIQNIHGHFSAANRTLKFFVGHWRSNCPAGPVPPVIVYGFDLIPENTMKVYAGPIQGPGACPIGDMLEFTFSKNSEERRRPQD